MHTQHKNSYHYSRFPLFMVLIFICSSSLIGQNNKVKDTIKKVQDGTIISKLPEIKAIPSELPKTLKLLKKKPSNSFALSSRLPKAKLNVEPKNQIQFLPKVQYRSPGHIYQDKIRVRPKPKSYKIKSDNYLGDFRNNGKFVNIICRDSDDVDGDRVRLTVNGRVIQSSILLTGNYKGYKVILEPGFNRIDITALNEGTYRPNTAEFRIFGDKEEEITSNRWKLTTGVTATVIIIKE